MEEEISLRELIEVVLKGKRMIATITITALLLSGFISFYVLDPTYEARATMMVVQPNIETAASDNSPLSVYLQSISESTRLSLDTYVNQVKNPAILERVRNRLELDPHEYTILAMSNIVKVNVPEKTNLIEITITHTDPQLAASLANTLAEEFVAFINEQSKERVGQSIIVLEEQLAAEEEKMNKALDEYTDFLSESRGVAHVEQAYQAKITLLTSFQTELAKTKVALETTRARLSEGEKTLTSLSPVIATEKSLLEDDLMRSYINENTGDTLEQMAGIKLENQEVNQAYIYMLQQVNADQVAVKELESKLSSLEEVITQTASEIEALQIELAEKKAVEERLVNKLDDAKKSYDRLVQKHEEALIATAIDSADAQINLVAPALVPISPVGPRKIVNLVLAGTLGLVLGCLVSFIRFYLDKNEVMNASTDYGDK